MRSYLKTAGHQEKIILFALIFIIFGLMAWAETNILRIYKEEDASAIVYFQAAGFCQFGNEAGKQECQGALKDGVLTLDEWERIRDVAEDTMTEAELIGAKNKIKESIVSMPH